MVKTDVETTALKTLDVRNCSRGDGTLPAVHRIPGASPGVRWRADAQWQLWPGDAAVAEKAVVTCERWSRLVARRLDDGAVMWDRACSGRRSPVIVDDAVVVGAGDREVHCYALHDGELRWRRVDPRGLRLVTTDPGPAGPLVRWEGSARTHTTPADHSSLAALTAASGDLTWERHLHGPLRVLPLGEVVLAGESQSLTWDGARVHRRDAEMVALDASTGQTRRRWRLPASLRGLAASPTEILAMCADGSNLRLRLNFAERERLPASVAASSMQRPTFVAGRWWDRAADMSGGLLVIDPGTLEVVARPLPTHRIAQGLVAVETGVLVGTQETVVHHLDPLGESIGQTHLRGKRLHGLLPVPRCRIADGPVAVALTKSGLVAIDRPELT